MPQLELLVIFEMMQCNSMAQLDSQWVFKASQLWVGLNDGRWLFNHGRMMHDLIVNYVRIEGCKSGIKGVYVMQKGRLKDSTHTDQCLTILLCTSFLSFFAVEIMQHNEPTDASLP